MADIFMYIVDRKGLAIQFRTACDKVFDKFMSILEIAISSSVI